MSAADFPQTHRGLAAAPGHATGPAYVLSEAPDGTTIPAGAVVVARIVHPHLAPLLARVAAMVVEEGALLQHATTLSREFGVPAVVGLRGARQILRDGDLVEVDGSTGEVTRKGPAR